MLEVTGLNHSYGTGPHGEDEVVASPGCRRDAGGAERQIDPLTTPASGPTVPPIGTVNVHEGTRERSR